MRTHSLPLQLLISYGRRQPHVVDDLNRCRLRSAYITIRMWASVDLSEYFTVYRHSTLPAFVFCRTAAAPGGRREPPVVVPGGGIASALLTVTPIFAG